MANSPTPAPPLADAAPSTPSLRTLGTGSQQAAAGNDSRFGTPTNAQTTPAPNKIPLADGTGVIAPGWLANASASISGLVSTSTQTFAGLKTFQNGISSDSLSGGSASSSLTITSNSTDDFTSGTIPAIKLKTSQPLSSSDLLFSVENSAGSSRFSVTEGAGVIADVRLTTQEVNSDSSLLLKAGTNSGSAHTIRADGSPTNIAVFSTLSGGTQVSVGLTGNITTTGALILTKNVDQQGAGYPNYFQGSIYANGLIGTSSGVNPTQLTGFVNNSASAVAVQVSAYNNLTTAGAKIASFGNNKQGGYSEKAYIDKDGVVSADSFVATTTSSAITGGGASSSLTIASNTPDSFTSSTVPAIKLKVNQTLTSSDLLFSVENSAGNARLTVTEGAGIGTDVRITTPEVNSGGGLLLRASASSGSAHTIRADGSPTNIAIFSTLSSGTQVSVGLTGDVTTTGGLILAKSISQQGGGFSNIFNGALYANNLIGTSSGVNPTQLTGLINDGASAVAVQVSAFNNLTTAGSKIVSFGNNKQGGYSEKAYIDKDGLVSGLSFTSTAASGAVAFTTTNTGARLNLGNSARYLYDNGSSIAVNASLAVDSISDLTNTTLTLASNVADSGSAVAVNIKSNNNLTTSGAKIVAFSNASSEKVSINKDGDINSTGAITLAKNINQQGGGFSNTFNGALYANNLIGTSSSVNPTQLTGLVNNSASAVAVQVSAYNNLTTAGAKIASFGNNKVGTYSEKAFIDKDGIVSGLSFTSTAASGADAFTSVTGSRLSLGNNGYYMVFNGSNQFTFQNSLLAASLGFTAANGQFQTSGNSTATLNGVVSDATNAVATVLRSNGTFAATGTKLVSIRNATTEKAYFDKDGNLGTPSIKFSDGTTQSTNAKASNVLIAENFGAGAAGIQAAIDSVTFDGSNYRGGAIIILPAGEIFVTTPIRIASRPGITLKGTGGVGGTRLTASGSGMLGKDIVEIVNSPFCVIEDLMFRGAVTANRPRSCIGLINDFTGSVPAPFSQTRRCTVRNVYMDGGDVARGGAQDTSFDYGIWVGGVSGYDGNNDFHSFYDVTIYEAKESSFYTDRSQAVDHTFINCFFSNSKYGVVGSGFHWMGGALGSNTIADFKPLPASSAGSFTVRGGNSENSYRFIDTSFSPGIYCNFSVEGFRWASVSGFAAADGYHIRFYHLGPFTMRNCRFQGDGPVVKIALAASSDGVYDISNNFWGQSGAESVADLIQYSAIAGNYDSVSYNYAGGVFRGAFQNNIVGGSGTQAGTTMPSGARSLEAFLSGSSGEPDRGYWKTGQRYYYLSPVRGGPLGQVCLSSGYAAPLWYGNTSYSQQDIRRNGDNVYAVTTSGVSAASGGPTGTGSSIVDGTVVWKYISPAPKFGLMTVIGSVVGTATITTGNATATVLNGNITTSSVIMATMQTADGANFIKSAVPTNGSFTVTLNANAGTNITIGYIVY